MQECWEAEKDLAAKSEIKSALNLGDKNREKIKTSKV